MQTLIGYAPQLLDLLEPVLAALIGLALARVTSFINARIKSENARAALLQLTDLAETTVKALEQTVVADLKDATKDGEFTAAEAQAVKDRAVALVMAQMGPASDIAQRLGMQEADKLRTFVESKIEAAVLDLRKGAL
jgi:hypothetical protein